MLSVRSCEVGRCCSAQVYSRRITVTEATRTALFVRFGGGLKEQHVRKTVIGLVVVQCASQNAGIHRILQQYVLYGTRTKVQPTHCRQHLASGS
jgi:hypothetical protein